MNQKTKKHSETAERIMLFIGAAITSCSHLHLLRMHRKQQFEDLAAAF